MIHSSKRRNVVLSAGVVTGLAALFIGARLDGAGTVPFTGGGKTETAAVAPSASVKKVSTEPEEHVIRSADGKPEAVRVGDATYPIRNYRPLAVSDPSGSQWWTRQTGLEDGWNVPLPTGAKATTVAVIDSGFALQHEEFANRWALNTGEQGATQTEANGANNCTSRGLPLDKSCNLIDDDANGFTDDFRGWDFSANDNDPQAGRTAPAGAGVAHGTMVAGVLGATGNNAKGIAGVDWSSRLLPLQALNDSESGNSLTVAKAVRYAADRGAQVINISLGTTEADPYVRLAVRYALDAGSIVVAASGNDGCDCISYPAAYPEVVAVGATKPDNTPASFSNFGVQLDIVAPGSGMTTTTWAAGNQTAAYASNVSGTSFAAPFVSGLLGRARAMQPEATWAELMATLNTQADHATLTPALPWSDKRGSGMAKAGTYAVRLATPAKPASRLYYQPLSGGHGLASQRAYQCEADEYGSLKVYELQKDGATQYTVNTLEKVRALENGWRVAREWYACAGLPLDTPGSPRTINLMAELQNEAAAKQVPAVFSDSLRGQALYVNAAVNQTGRPAAITSQPIATWIGDWSGDPQTTASRIVNQASAAGRLASLVAYNIPARDCGQHSAGGAAGSTAYRTWIDGLAAGIGQRQAIVILEPDALAQLDCLSPVQQAQRNADLAYAVETLTGRSRAFVYVDAGHGAWQTADTMAARLQKVAIAKARGFSLNVSNFQTTADSTAYGNQLSARTGGKPFVIDTSRNGKGPKGTEWCNPSGRGLGARPTTATTGNVDALLWIKYPGESDGACNGGPAAGMWWAAYAQELIANAAP